MGKKKEVGGVPDYMVTFADLMSILVCFFVLLISFSIQDKQKLQVVAGSMKDAFGIQFVNRKAGMIEIEGAPVRQHVKQIAPVMKKNDTDFANIRHDERHKQGPEANTHDIEKNEIERPRQFALAAASLRQAWQEMPEITHLSSHLMLEETPEGLHIQLIDQEARSMFPAGSSRPYEHTRKLLAAMAPIIKRLPNRLKLMGHTDAKRLYQSPGLTLWDLSADRAKEARRILAENGVPHDKFYEVGGKADVEPLFPEDPYLAANQRISILIMAEKPPLPAGHTLKKGSQ
ncbi:MAG: membrane protein [Rhodomicrobium sp.]|nr:MAG: membrane protein [Rhodomicrobium sp.]